MYRILIKNVLCYVFVIRLSNTKIIISFKNLILVGLYVLSKFGIFCVLYGLIMIYFLINLFKIHCATRTMHCSNACLWKQGCFPYCSSWKVDVLEIEWWYSKNIIYCMSGCECFCIRVFALWLGCVFELLHYVRGLSRQESDCVMSCSCQPHSI